MIRINLLPVRQTRKLEAARRELALAVVGAVGVLVLGLGAWGALTVRLAAVQSENTKLQAEIDRLAADVAKVDEMEKFRAELQRKLDVISQLRDKKSGPVHMLDELTTATPERLQLSSLDEQGGKVTLEGVAVTNEVISQFLRALDASPYYESVYLQNIEAMPARADMSVTPKKFKITAQLTSPKAEAAEAAAASAVAGTGAKDAKAGGADAKAAPPAGGAAPTPAAGGDE